MEPLGNRRFKPANGTQRALQARAAERVPHAAPKRGRWSQAASGRAEEQVSQLTGSRSDLESTRPENPWILRSTASTDSCSRRSLALAPRMRVLRISRRSLSLAPRSALILRSFPILDPESRIGEGCPPEGENQILDNAVVCRSHAVDVPRGW